MQQHEKAIQFAQGNTIDNLPCLVIMHAEPHGHIVRQTKGFFFPKSQ